MRGSREISLVSSLHRASVLIHPPSNDQAWLYSKEQLDKTTLMLARDSLANIPIAPPLPVKTRRKKAWLLVRKAESAVALLFLNTESEMLKCGVVDPTGRLL